MNELENGNLEKKDSMNPYDSVNMQETISMGEADKKPKKKISVKAAVSISLVAGLVIGCIIPCIGIKLYCEKAGKSIIISGSKTDTTILDSKTVAKVNEVLDYIDSKYYDEVKVEDLQNGLIEGLVDGVGDIYTEYYTAEEYAEILVDTNGSFCGIGAGLVQNKDTMVVTISTVYKGTPAKKAGLKDGDIILYVDDIDATSMELDDLVGNIRGDEGTSVHLQIYRSSTKETLDFDIVRKDVEIPSVDGQMLTDTIGYIQISKWSSNTASQFEEEVERLTKKGMTSIVIDVRSNPGGLVTSAVAVLDDLLPEGILVYTEDKDGKKNVYSSDKECMDCPIAVLVDENSASASEIFAGAIKDYERGKLIGTTTYGKGIVQTIYPLNDDDAIKITTAKYFTPNGNYIHEVGIEPDINLEYEFLGESGEDYSVEKDNQIQKAISVLEKENK